MFYLNTLCSGIKCHNYDTDIKIPKTKPLDPEWKVMEISSYPEK